MNKKKRSENEGQNPLMDSFKDHRIEGIRVGSIGTKKGWATSIGKEKVTGVSYVQNSTGIYHADSRNMDAMKGVPRVHEINPMTNHPYGNRGRRDPKNSNSNNNNNSNKTTNEGSKKEFY